MPAQSCSFVWKGATFTVAVQHGADNDDDDEARFAVTAKLYAGSTVPTPSKKRARWDYDDEEDLSDYENKKDDGKIGLIVANLLPRPSRYFLEYADEISSETAQLATIFCDARGIANRVSGMPKDAVRGGGFFHIDTVEIHPRHKGKDLGIRFLHQVLLVLQGEWTLAVMMPSTLNYCTWSENAVSRDSQHAAADRKVRLQFARLGFCQAGRTSNLCSAWFLAASSFLDKQSSKKPEKCWKSKKDVANLVIHQTPQKVEATGLDRKLVDVVSEYSMGEEASLSSMMIAPFGRPPARNGDNASESAAAKRAKIARMEKLVARGASVNTSGSLQAAAANASDNSEGIELLNVLIRLGGDVNYQDELGNTALHVAARFQKGKMVKHLIQLGASTTLANLDGQTPLQTLEQGIQSTADFGAAFGLLMPIRKVDVLPKFECITALMPSEQRSLLKDGWMSPRMRHALKITAELQADGILVDSDVTFMPRQPLPLSECVYMMSRIDYIPSFVLQANPDGFYQSFYEGWGYCFQAMADLLRRGRAPTVDRVESQLSRSPVVDPRKLQHFLTKGGKVEYAVDALINITRNVCVNGDDGWEYDTFEDDIEAHQGTALDKSFDIARFFCIHQGGGSGSSQGPYNHHSRYRSDSEDNDFEEEGDY